MEHNLKCLSYLDKLNNNLALINKSKGLSQEVFVSTWFKFLISPLIQCNLSVQSITLVSDEVKLFHIAQCIFGTTSDPQ